MNVLMSVARKFVAEIWLVPIPAELEATTIALYSLLPKPSTRGNVAKVVVIGSIVVDAGIVALIALKAVPILADKPFVEPSSKSGSVELSRTYWMA